MRLKFQISNCSKNCLRQNKFQIKLLLLLVTCYLLLTLSPKPLPLNPNVLAAGSQCDTIHNRASGLISVGGTGNNFITGSFGSSNGTCILDSKAAFFSLNVPKYADLKSTYFDQSKKTKQEFTDTLPSISDQNLYHTSGNLTLASNPSGSGTAIVFVDGNLDITGNITYGTETTGLVFVVNGNVGIASSVTTINAIIISQSTIYTAALASTGCSTSNVTASALTINGSLISLSLDPAQNIKFCRILSSGNDTTPAEVINQKPKYLVILKDIFSGTLQKWSEVAGVPYNPTPFPTPTPTPTITPTPLATPTPTPSLTPTPTPTPQPPAIDLASSTAVTNQINTPTWTHNTSASPSLVIVGVSIKNTSSQTVSSITYGGQPLAIKGTPLNNGSHVSIELWYRKNPLSGPQPVVVTLSAAASFTAGALTFTNTNAINPLGTFVTTIGNSTSPTIIVTSSSSEIVADVMAAGQTGQITAVSATKGADQTEKWNQVNTCGGCDKVRGTGSIANGATSVTMYWNLSGGSRPWAIGAVTIKPP